MNEESVTMAKLYWQTVGEGKQDLVLLHGWGLNAQVWQTIIPRIASHFRVHLVDLPGYGRSQGSPHEYSIDGEYFVGTSS